MAAIPTLEIGLVIHYGYLWHEQADAGMEEGVKDRPCVIVSAKPSVSPPGHLLAAVMPITHSKPVSESLTLEIPQATKIRLGLDGERSWIIASEANRFIWPGPDLRFIPGSEPRRIAYGPLPPKFYYRLLEVVRQNTTRLVAR